MPPQDDETRLLLRDILKGVRENEQSIGGLTADVSRASGQIAKVDARLQEHIEKDERRLGDLERRTDSLEESRDKLDDEVSEITGEHVVSEKLKAKAAELDAKVAADRDKAEKKAADEAAAARTVRVAVVCAVAAAVVGSGATAFLSHLAFR